MLPNIEAIYLDTEQSRDIRKGKKIQFTGFSSIKKIKLYDDNKQFIGIGESNLLSEVLPKRLFI